MTDAGLLLFDSWEQLNQTLRIYMQENEFENVACKIAIVYGKLCSEPISAYSYIHQCNSVSIMDRHMNIASWQYIR